MKTNFLSKLVFGYLILSVTNVDAQIGINTINPKGIFHIDGKIDNNSEVTADQALNDFMISNEGKLGIGTINPGNRLEINSGNSENNTLRFMSLNSLSQPSGNDAIKAIGVDSNGDVVVMPLPVLNVLPGSCIQPYALLKGAETVSVTMPRTTNNADGDYKGYVLSKHFVKEANSIAGTQRNIDFDESTGRFKLKAGNTYRLESSILMFTNDGYIQTRWKVMGPGGDFIGNLPRATIFSGPETYQRDGDQGRSMAIYTAKFDTEVALVVSEAIKARSFLPYNSYASVVQMNPCKLQRQP